MAGLYLPPLCTIHPWSQEALGPQLNAWNVGMSGAAQAAWSANRAFYVPFKLASQATVRQLWAYNGGTVSGNIDIGIYSQGGVRLCSAGSTSQAGTNAMQVFDIADLTMGPGRFYLAAVLDNSTGTLFRSNLAAASQDFMGLFQQASAFPLPPTATFAAMATVYLPVFGLSTRSLI